MWRQDHNGFSHQDPGFIDHVVNKKADVIRVYLLPDAITHGEPDAADLLRGRISRELGCAVAGGLVNFQRAATNPPRVPL